MIKLTLFKFFLLLCVATGLFACSEQSAHNAAQQTSEAASAPSTAHGSSDPVYREPGRVNCADSKNRDKCQTVRTLLDAAQKACAGTPPEHQCVLRQMLRHDMHVMCEAGAAGEACRKNAERARAHLRS